VEDYRPSKFHPIHLGDRFKDGRYRVLRNLGYGAYSTVWLARDEQYGLTFVPEPSSIPISLLSSTLDGSSQLLYS
ncbi:hypothetical protein BJ875DRAFT_377469, partial [Amylocarpus encephaloides]